MDIERSFPEDRSSVADGGAFSRSKGSFGSTAGAGHDRFADSKVSPAR